MSQLHRLILPLAFDINVCFGKVAQHIIAMNRIPDLDISQLEH